MHRQSGIGIPVITSLLYLNAVKVFYGPPLVRNFVLLWAIGVSGGYWGTCTTLWLAIPSWEC